MTEKVRHSVMCSAVVENGKVTDIGLIVLSERRPGKIVKKKREE